MRPNTPESCQPVKRSRDPIFDIARSIAIIIIVVFWHLFNYAEYKMPEWYYNSVKILVLGSMGSLVLISGFFLGKHSITSLSDTKAFYVKRFKRFWVLFFIASLLLYVPTTLIGYDWYTGGDNFLLSLMGLTCFYPPMPPTLWFMNMMMLFYVITPCIISVPKKYGLLISAIMMSLLLIGHQYDYADIRVVRYYPIYVIGLLISESVIEFIKCHYSILMISSFVILLAYNSFISDEEWPIVIIGASIIFLFSLSTLLSKYSALSKLGTKVSYASMCMYFFHRHIFMALSIPFLMVNKDQKLPICFLLIVALPLIYFTSVTIQRCYDTLVDKLERLELI